MKKFCLTLALLICSATMSNAFWFPDFGYSNNNNYSSSVEANIRTDANTQRLIAIYRQNPTENNRMNLKNQIGVDYDRAVAKQQEKLAELRRVTNNQARINAMQESINDMIRNREHRINQQLANYTYSTQPKYERNGRYRNHKNYNHGYHNYGHRS